MNWAGVSELRNKLWGLSGQGGGSAPTQQWCGPHQVRVLAAPQLVALRGIHRPRTVLLEHPGEGGGGQRDPPGVDEHLGGAFRGRPTCAGGKKLPNQQILNTVLCCCWDCVQFLGWALPDPDRPRAALGLNQVLNEQSLVR